MRHREAPYLPCLLQLRRPPLLQDGLHGADEFCSDVLENNRVGQLLLVLLYLGQYTVVYPLVVSLHCYSMEEWVCGWVCVCASAHSAAVILRVSV